MKIILCLLFVISTGCSATFATRGSPIRIQNCPTSFIPPILDTVAGIAGGALAAKLPQIKNDEYKQTVFIGGAVIFNISAIMGLAEIYQCRQRANDVKYNNYRSTFDPTNERSFTP